MDANKRQSLLSWLFMGALFVFCAVLGVLQYRWIGEVSVAARERLRGTLQASISGALTVASFIIVRAGGL